MTLWALVFVGAVFAAMVAFTGLVLFVGRGHGD